jgi:hypothetical protein
MDDKEKYMRWLETMWDLHNRISREEKRKAEVLEIFEGLARLSRRRVEAPYSPPWEPSRWWKAS